MIAPQPAARVTVRLRPPAPASRATVRQPARVARVLALAHHIAAALDAATLRDQAALARALGFTRARISQLLDLTLLAPEIQEHLLFLDAVDGREPMPERALRRLATLPWNEQRRLFCSAGT